MLLSVNEAVKPCVSTLKLARGGCGLTSPIALNVSDQPFILPVSAPAVSCTCNAQSPVATSPLNASEVKLLIISSEVPPSLFCNVIVVPCAEISFTIKSPDQV